MLDASDYRLRARLLFTAGLVMGWLGALFVGTVALSSAQRGGPTIVLGALAGLIAFIGPWAFPVLYPDADSLSVPRIVSTAAMTGLSLAVLFFAPYGVLQTSGRDVAAVVTDVHWCEAGEIDCTSELRLARLPERTDFGWSGTCLLRKPNPGDQIVVRVDHFGLFAAREKSCVFGTPGLFRLLGVLAAAAILAHVAYVFQWALKEDG